MGHGSCDVFNKQTVLVGPGGRATSDAKVIAQHAWRILESFHFDPKELRGIGIQIQKLEPTDGPVNTDLNQKRLPFKPSAVVRRPPLPAPAPAPLPLIRAASASAATFAGLSTDASLPAIEEVDPAVLKALPLEVQQELEQAWRRRSESPFPGKPPPPLQSGSGLSRSRSAAPPGVFPERMAAPPSRMQHKGLKLAPRTGPYVIDKNSLHPNRPANSFLRPTELDIRGFGFDPEVFALLPRSVQREQLTAARLIRTTGGIPEVSGERLVLKPKRYDPPADLFRQPPPYAKYPEPPKLRQQGRKGEKAFFTETDDVQGLLEAWVHAFKEFPPNAKDIEFFAKFLVQAVDSERSSDTGVERAIAIVKWWLVLLRRYWGDYERFEAVGEDAEDAKVPEAWWKAFRDVKERIDIVARKKFGGRLSLR
jgi:DNA repair protein REV1